MLRKCRTVSLLSALNQRALIVALISGVLLFAQPLAALALAQSHSSDALAHRAQSVAAKMDTVGWCYAGVKQALRSFGVALSGAAAWMAADQLKSDHRFTLVKQSTLQRGDILVHDRSAKHPYGHIAVYLGDGAEASDHVQHLVVGGHYGPTAVFRFKNSAVASRHTSAAAPKIAVSHKPASQPIRVASAAIPREPVQPKRAKSQPNTSKPAVDPTAVAQAKKEADLYRYLYSQGAVSRNDAESKLDAYRRLQPSPETRMANSSQPPGPSS